MDAFLCVIASSLSPIEFFDPDNVAPPDGRRRRARAMMPRRGRLLL
jgi:hypothetical protein